jgi:cyclopropane fatty-acyl-phospholipid synthase-like methyltransferase
MERIPEEELMDDREQAKAYSDADFSEPHNAFVEHFRKRFSDFPGGSVLDLGCGPADVTLRFAAAFPATRILGVDGAQAMLDIGNQEILSRSFAHRVTLKKNVLPDNELLKTRFDAIISNSLLHHLSSSGILWQTVKQCAQPCAPIFVMDLLRPDGTAEARELVKTYAADASPLLQQDFYNSLLAAYNEDEIRQQLFTYGLHYLNTEIISDRHVIVWGRKRAYGQ